MENKGRLQTVWRNGRFHCTHPFALVPCLRSSELPLPPSAPSCQTSHVYAGHPAPGFTQHCKNANLPGVPPRKPGTKPHEQHMTRAPQHLLQHRPLSDSTPETLLSDVAEAGRGLASTTSPLGCTLSGTANSLKSAALLSALLTALAATQRA